MSTNIKTQESLLLEILQKLTKLESKFETRFNQLEERMDRLEMRIDKLEMRMDKLEKRIDVLEERISNLEKRFDYHFKEVMNKFDTVYVHLDGLLKISNDKIYNIEDSLDTAGRAFLLTEKSRAFEKGI